jgi:hypothetical protein
VALHYCKSRCDTILLLLSGIFGITIVQHDVENFHNRLGSIEKFSIIMDYAYYFCYLEIIKYGFL